MSAYIEFQWHRPRLHNSSNIQHIFATPFCEVTFRARIIIRTAVDGVDDDPVLGQDSNNFIFAPDGYVSKDIIEMQNGGNDFVDFNVGDEIVVTGSSSNDGTYTLVEKLDDSTIRVDSVLTEELIGDPCIVYVNTEYRSVDFYYGLVPNNEGPSYLSEVTGEIQKWQVDDVPSVTTQSMTPVGTGWYDQGSASITNFGVSANGTQTIQITHNYYFRPYKLFPENGMPNFFQANNCLKYVWKADFKEFAVSTDKVLEFEFSEYDGNTGWFDERMNIGATPWEIQSVSFEKESDNTPISGILLSASDRTLFDITIHKPGASWSGPSSARLSLIKKPNSVSEYEDTTKNLKDKFLWNEWFNSTSAGTPSAPDFGDNIVECQVTQPTPDTLRYVGIIDMAPNYFDLLSEPDSEYLIGLTTRDPGLMDINTDLTTLQIEGVYVLDLGIENSLSVLENKFIQGCDTEIPDTDNNCFYLGDEVTLYTRVKLDTTEAVFDPSLVSFEGGVRLFNTATQSFTVLQSITSDVSGNVIVNGLQNVDQEIITQFQGELDQFIKKAIFKRDLTADAPDCWEFDVYIPFKVDWRYWEENNLLPADLFDPSEPNNNLNYSYKLKEVGDYELEAFVRIIVEFNGTFQQYVSGFGFDALDYMEGSDWGNPLVEITDENGNNLGLNVLGDQDVYFKMCFDYIGTGGVPSIDDVEWFANIGPFEADTPENENTLSSVLERNGQLSSLDLSNLGTKSVSGITHCFEGKIRGEELAGIDCYSLRARIYDKRTDPKPADAFLYEDLTCWLFEDGTFHLSE